MFKEWQRLRWGVVGDEARGRVGLGCRSGGAGACVSVNIGV